MSDDTKKPEDTPPPPFRDDPLARLPFAPPGLKNPIGAMMTSMVRPETLALIEEAIRKRRPDLERFLKAEKSASES